MSCLLIVIENICYNLKKAICFQYKDKMFKLKIKIMQTKIWDKVKTNFKSKKILFGVKCNIL